MAGDWEEVTVESIASRIAMGPFGSDIKTDNFVPSGVPVIRGNNLTSGRFRAADFVFLTEDKADQLANANAYPGDLVFTHRGTLGQVGLVPDEPFKRYVVSQSQMKLTCDETVADPLFIYYFFKSPAGQHALLMHISQTGVPAISRPVTSLKGIRLPLPPLAEQRAIAHILGTLDDKIELNQSMNETLEAMARALFKSWFVDFDPVRAKAEGRDPGLPRSVADLFPERFEGSELGKIPKGWEVRALYDCAAYINGSAFRNDDFSQERAGLPVIKIGELKDGITSQTKFTEANLDLKYRIMSGDILFSWSGSPDTSIDIFVWTGGDGWLNQHIFKVKFYRPQEKVFVYSLLRHFKTVFVEIARNKQTTGLGHVTAQDLKRLKTVFPPDVVLQAFNRVVEPLLQSAYGNSCESLTLAALRDTLLPQLVSGELGVKDAERFIGRVIP
jgi:type I restriction enzyme, S subunit